jgi:hypothetical protein
VAKRAPNAELLSYNGLDHFDVYVGDGFDQLNRDQLAFLYRVVPTSEPTRSPHVGNRPAAV